MKNALTTLLFFATTFCACTKENLLLPEDNGCIDKVSVPVTSHGTLSDSDYDLISSLFISNGISKPNFRYTRTYRDSVQTYNGTYDFRNVHIIQYANGLPIFTETLNYSFRNGIFDSHSGSLTNGTKLNTRPALRLAQLRKLFIDDIESFDHNSSQYRDSCFNAEFGYFNLNAGTGSSSENLVKAWHLTLKSNLYPEAYYHDKSGKRIYYFNGIETFK
jgi:hypothetical protein